MYKNKFKYFFDFLIAFVLLIVFSPIIILIMIGLAFFNKGTPFFMQSRPGKNEKIFKLIKFKTMRDAYDDEGKPLPDKNRIF
jgi:lipopolysaccharide/colanic/teichoic acid biosynthesis glycosyltransferase